MALFRNLGVNLRNRLCDVPTYVSAQSLEFLDLAKNCSFLNWKLTLVPIMSRFVYGWAQAKVSMDSTSPINMTFYYKWSMPTVKVILVHFIHLILLEMKMWIRPNNNLFVQRHFKGIY